MKCVLVILNLDHKKLIKAKVKYLDDVNVDIVQLRCLTAENGLMVVDIDFENNYRKKQQTDFLISWYENNGMAAETDLIGECLSYILMRKER